LKLRDVLFTIALLSVAGAAGPSEAYPSRTIHQARSSGGGLASVYSGGRTASGESMRAGGLTAAHPSLPFGTRVRVTNNHTGRSVVVRINDRGPFVRGRVIDLSPAAAQAIGVSGVSSVSLHVGG
jgi:rare lipoprotein A